MDNITMDEMYMKRMLNNTYQRVPTGSTVMQDDHTVNLCNMQALNEIKMIRQQREGSPPHST